MAFLAQERGTGFQQWRDVGSVRCMAVGAIFCCRLMFPQEWTAFFSMAAKAGFIQRVFLEQLGASRAVWVVAIGANHLALWHRVVRRPVHLRAYVLVAGVANFGLGGTHTYFVNVVMNLVAGVARYVGCVVLAARPQRALGVLGMAAQAGGAALAGRQRRVLGEHAVRVRLHRHALWFFSVVGAGSVATDAVWCALVSGKPVRRFADVGPIILIVASLAQRSTDWFRRGFIGGPGRAEQAEKAQAKQGRQTLDLHRKPLQNDF